VTRLAELWRYGQAAAVNTAFGYGLFALLVWAGVERFAAQALATIAGVAFNYLVYSRHVFRDRQGSKASFVLAYGLHYLMNVALLALFGAVIASVYVAGLLATLGASLANYLLLRSIVFRTRTAA
jgi:putative flippase GtrA